MNIAALLGIMFAICVGLPLASVAFNALRRAVRNRRARGASEEIAMSLLCESCEQRAGTTNSRFWKDGNYEGHWVCGECEEEMDINQTCLCGCDNNPKRCVYSEVAKAEDTDA